MKKILMVTLLSLAISTTAMAKVKFIQKPDKSYDFKEVKNIVIMPVTSKNVDFGKVDKDRMPKIETLLTKTKDTLRKNMIEGTKKAKTTIPFHYNAPNRKPTTLIMKYNIDQFDNGNAAARLVPLAGKAKVTMTVELINAKDKSVIGVLQASAKAKGGFVGGGLDSEVLWHATNMANGDIMQYIKKQTGLDYSFWAGAAAGTKTAVKDQKEMMKEEKQELKKKK
ncbi:MAG: DUF4410 domain-containing protein [Pseudomonadota bacterium]